MGLLSWLFGKKGKHAPQQVPSAKPSYVSRPAPVVGNDSTDDWSLLADFQAHAVRADAVVLDTETINSPIGVQVIEIGAILLRNGSPIHEYGQLMAPASDLTMAATLFSGITEADIAMQPRAGQIIPLFTRAIQSLDVIGHNVAYDINAINQEAARAGCLQLRNNTIDTMLIGGAMFPNAPSMSLLELARLLGVSDTEEHRALADARQTLECWKRLNSMDSPIILSHKERDWSKRRSEAEKRRRDKIFAKSAYLQGRNLIPVNDRPEGQVIETIDCGVEISGDEHHQDLLRGYGYDAWLWVYVAEDRIRKGQFIGYPTYWVYLDGEEIGHISKYQMERHCGQVPADGAVMLAHIPDRAKDIEVGRWQLRLQMPEGHEPMDLSDQVVKPDKPQRKPSTVKIVEKSAKQPVRHLDDTVFVNAKPHKKVLAPIGRSVTIDSAQEADTILSYLDDGAHAWVTVKPSADLLVIRFTGRIIGTTVLPDDLEPFGDEAKVAAATISKRDGKAIITVELP